MIDDKFAEIEYNGNGNHPSISVGFRDHKGKYTFLDMSPRDWSAVAREVLAFIEKVRKDPFEPVRQLGMEAK